MAKKANAVKVRMESSAGTGYRYYKKSKRSGVQLVPVLYISGMGPNADWDVFAKQVPENILKVIKKKYDKKTECLSISNLQCDPENLVIWPHA